jgi:dTDP-4-dehydrorhamnose reductase
VRRWTPINEPLTTARFSALYGVWYPRRFDDHRAFGLALTNQVLAIEYAMEAIRRSAPGAELVLTEDLQGFVALDDGAQAYAAHKRERAFLSVELLLGRVGRGHALYRYLRETCGVERRVLAEIAARATPPALVGWNYYPYSERTLRTGAGGGIDNLATVEAGPHEISPRPLLRAAHARIGLPFGLAEVHVDAPEAQRVRWLLSRHADLVALRAEGLPANAFGAWAAFGMCDWNSLLVRRDGRREDGVFAFAEPGATPKPTAVARALRALATGEAVAAPLSAGWWERLEANSAGSAAPRRSPEGSNRRAAGTTIAAPGGTS